MGFLGSVAKFAGDAYDSVSETVGEVADVAGGVVDGVASGAGGVIDGASDVAGGVLDTVVDTGASIAEDPLAFGRSAVDLVGNNIVGFGVDLASKAGPLTKLAGPLGKVTGPIGLLSCALGTYDEAQNLGDPEAGESQKDFNLNNFLSNGVGAVGGLLSTAGMIGGSGATAAALGSAGSVIGAGAAGLLGGQYMAEAADGQYGRDENGRTTWDENTDAANRTREWVNGALGSEPDGLAGTIAGGVHAGIGGIGAGLVGGGRAATNWFSDTFL